MKRYNVSLYPRTIPLPILEAPFKENDRNIAIFP